MSKDQIYNHHAIKRLVIMAKVLTVLYNLYVIGFCSTTPKMRMWYMCSGMWPRISHLWLHCISLLKLDFFSGREWLGSRSQLEYQHSGQLRSPSSCLRTSKTFTLSYIAWDNNWYRINFISRAEWNLPLCAVWKGWANGFFWTF